MALSHPASEYVTSEHLCFVCGTVLHPFKKPGLALIIGTYARAGLTTSWPLWLLALGKELVEGGRL